MGSKSSKHATDKPPKPPKASREKEKKTSGKKLRYRPLDLANGEFRLLRILPSTSRTYAGNGPTFNPEVVQCRLEYEFVHAIDAANQIARQKNLGHELVLETLFAEMPGLKSIDDQRALAGFKQSMRVDLQKDVDENVSFSMHAQRVSMLQAQFAGFTERYKTWLPDDFATFTSSHTWESWLKTWIWSPLSGDERYPQKSTIGYLALSYVWNDQRTLRDVDDKAAAIVKAHQAGGTSYPQAIKNAGLEPYMHRIDGGQPGTGQIIVDGVLVEVGRNLEKALRTLREIPEVQCGKRVWVDSLCIDQSSLKEKAHEVMRMGEIYKKSERVVSWIGDENDGSCDALEIMNVIGQAITTEADSVLLSKHFFDNIRSEFSLRVAQLMARSYWSRIWVMQEIVMGNDKAITICGARCFPTAMLLTFGPRITTNSPALKFNAHFDLAEGRADRKKTVSASSLQEGLSKLRDLRQLQVNLDTITTNAGTMSTFWFRTASGNFATDPRDTVYGMLNILPKPLVSLLKVDYAARNTYRDVMIDFAIANFTCNQSLAWLLCRPCSPFPGYQEWPSWVPNLGLHFSLAHFNWNLVQSDCNAGSAPMMRFKAMIDGNNYTKPALAVNGLLVDAISAATTSITSTRRAQHAQFIAVPHIADQFAKSAGIPSDTFSRMNQIAILSCFPEPESLPGLQLQSSQQHRYRGPEGLKLALTQCFERMTLRTKDESQSIFDIPIQILRHGVEPVNSAAILAAPTMPVQALPFLKQFIENYGNFDLWGTRLCDLFATNSNRPVPELTIYDGTASLVRLFTTASGYVGTALCPLRAGDQIFLIPGCRMPVALRPSPRVQSGAWELLGGVFVPGLMHGEGWRDLSKNSDIIILM